MLRSLLAIEATDYIDSMYSEAAIAFSVACAFLWLMSLMVDVPSVVDPCVDRIDMGKASPPT